MSIILSTDVAHNISDLEFKQAISETSSRIRYGGEAFLKELKELNAKYIIPTNKVKFIREEDLAKSINEREYSTSQIN